MFVEVLRLGQEERRVTYYKRNSLLSERDALSIVIGSHRLTTKKFPSTITTCSAKLINPEFLPKAVRQRGQNSRNSPKK